MLYLINLCYAIINTVFNCVNYLEFIKTSYKHSDFFLYLTQL